MARNWTPAQQEAIWVRGRNVLVSAAAGAGKTAVLVERLLQLILKEHIGVDQILMVTFTNAAAGEMRSRIYQKLQETLETVEELEKPWVRKQLHLVGAASISTIHAFCMEVVRQYAFMLQLDPRFRVGDPTEIQLLREEVVQEVLEQAYETSDTNFLSLADLFTTPRSDQKLRELIFQVYDFLQNQPDPEAWMREKVELFVPDLSQMASSHPLFRKQALQAELLLQGAEDGYAKALQMLEEDPVLAEKYQPILQAEWQLVHNFKRLAAENFEQARKDYQPISFARLPNPPKTVDETLKKNIQQLRNQCKERLNELGQWLGKSWQETLLDLQAMQPVAQALQDVIFAFDASYQRNKKERGLLDFNDLEHDALRLLRFPEVAAAYRERFAEIFVDEYQDSNLVQEEILRCISRKNHVFRVGDVKQSIYRFRSADPDLFRDYYETYRQQGELPEISGCVVDMQHNFRSTQNILAAINDLFAHIMQKQTAELDYDEQAKLYPGPEQIVGPVTELLLVETGSGIQEEKEEEDSDDLMEELERMSGAELEAAMIAQKIQTLMQESVGERPVRYHDIVILMRSLVSQADITAQILEEHGIPVYTSQGKGYFQVIEVMMFLDLLRLLDNRLQDLPLLGVLRSPIGHFSVEDLVQIRVQFPHSSYQKAMQEYAFTVEDALAARLRDFMEQCETWQEEARIMPLSDFLWKLMQDTGYYEYVGAMPGGTQRQANLRLLLEKAEIFQQKPQQGLFRFLQYIERVQQSGSKDDGVAGLLTENDDVVRIMSVHKSKGLEFPIVFLMGLGKRMNFRDTQAKLLLHKDLGIGMQYADREKHIVRDTLPRKMIAQTIRMEQLAEEMRIFYVACTRAQQRLILSAGLKNIAQACRRWSLGPGIYEISHAGSWIDWVGMVLMQHPDGFSLWEQIEEAYAPKEDFLWSSHWNLEIRDRSRFLQELQQKAQKKEKQKQNLKQELQHFAAIPKEKKDWYTKLIWQYPFQAMAEIPSKMTVTQLKQMQYPTEEGSLEDSILPELSFKKPEEGRIAPFTARQRGTLTHQLLRQLDFSRAQTLKQLQEQIRGFQKNGFFTEEESQAIDLMTIYRLVNGPLGERIRQAPHLYREVPFNLLLPAEKIFPELKNVASAVEPVMVQGIIDLYFEEQEGWVLVDYKTDFAGSFEEARAILKERYALQIGLYSQALEKLTHRKVKTAGLYLLSYGKFVELSEEERYVEDLLSMRAPQIPPTSQFIE